ncbi:EAL domain-containing protein [Sphingomonas citri]
MAFGNRYHLIGRSRSTTSARATPRSSTCGNFPVDVIKIDRSFVADLLTDPGDAAIVDAVLGLANQLGIAVVAEGVETPEQAAYLLAKDCGHAQGYLFGRPMPAGAAEALLVTASEHGRR